MMIDLHSHILPNICDGPKSMDVSLEMARMAVDDGITVQACTPHIYPNVYKNNAINIQQGIDAFKEELASHAIPLKLVIGADTHMVPNVLEGLNTGRIPCLNNSRYFLLEPSHHVAVPRFVERTVQIIEAGYTPLITHPERLAWIDTHYSEFEEVARKGAWIQITAGAIDGKFGKKARHWAEKFLEDGLVHIIATDSHNNQHRPPVLSRGVALAESIVGAEEANKMVNERALAVIKNIPVADVSKPLRLLDSAQVNTAQLHQKKKTGFIQNLFQRL